MSTKLSTIFPPAMAEGETPKDWSRRLVNALNEFALDVDFLTSGILRYGESPTTEGVYAGPGGVGYWSEGTSAWTVIIGADGSMQIVGATGNSLTFDGTNLSVEGSITAEAGR